MREELNKHLTNNVVLRIDYIPLPDEKVDTINNILAKKFLVEDKKFSDSKQTFMRSIDIQMNDPSIQDFNEFINIREKSKVKSYEYYKLSDDNSNIEMKLIFNRQFCAIDVNQLIKYYKYESYRDIFIDVLSILKDNEIIVNRFGLRKFNDFFLNLSAPVGDYVNEKYFNLDCDDILDGSNSLISEKRYNFSKEIYNVNLTTHSSVGKLDNDIVKRIAFDIDLYITDMQNLQKLFELNNDKFIDGVNDLLFEIYINVLEDKMKKLLNKDSELDDKNIIYGVDYNENT